MYVSAPIMVQGTCSTGRPGFDGCPVAVAVGPQDYCRTETNVTVSCNLVCVCQGY